MASSESREEWIVREARKRPLADRSSFLDGACAGDNVLRQRIETLLRAEQPSETAATVPEAQSSTVKVSRERRQRALTFGLWFSKKKPCAPQIRFWLWLF